MARSFDAIILDMDGVVTNTATLHSKAWKITFDEYNQERTTQGLSGFEPFDIRYDYKAYVDGKLRVDGIRSFLNSRRVVIPEEKVIALSEKKNRLYLSLLKKRGPGVYDDAVNAVKKWKQQGLMVGLISSSKNARTVLEAGGIFNLFDVIIDGNVMEEIKMPGKPAPGIFLVAAQALQVQVKSVIVIEDAISGVEAARHGGFGKIIGVARQTSGDELLTAGADIVVRDCNEISLSTSNRELKEKWSLIYKSWNPVDESTRESLCTLANGYIGTRGANEESSADQIHYPATYVAGTYNRLTSQIKGHMVENEDRVNWPNWLCLSFRPKSGEWLDLQETTLLKWEQELDLQSGILIRKLRVRDQKGRETSLQSRRIVSMADPHLAAIEWQLTPENWPDSPDSSNSNEVEIVIRSALDGNVRNAGVERYQNLKSRHLNIVKKGEFNITSSERGIYLVTQSNQSQIRVAQCARTRVQRDGLDEGGGSEDKDAIMPRAIVIDRDGFIAHEYAFRVARGRPIRIEKVVALYCSRDRAISEPLDAAKQAVARAPAFRDIMSRHETKWSYLWRRAGMELTRNSREQLILRLHQFHILQTHSIHSIDRDAGIPARGIHGEGYHGHVFWDELFVFPFFNFRIPELSRELLDYRFHRLNEARFLAREAGFQGAMYPWQSGSTGREETPKYHLNPLSKRWTEERTALQIHVNAAIVYNIWQYYQVTLDREFMAFRGAEMMLEIARFWVSRSLFNAERGRYEIKRVVGPDEFHVQYPGATEPGIDNNAYTNFMASWALRQALNIWDSLDQERRRELETELKIESQEIQRWSDVSRKLYIPFRADGLIEQFEGYDRLSDFDFAYYRRKYGDIQRLDRILELEGRGTQSYNAIKQADVLMLFYLFSTEALTDQFSYLGYAFDPATIPRNIHYYLSKTVHGSTLSRAVYSWVLSRVDRSGSWQLFRDALESDISDIQGGTTREGVHLGAMAETVDLVQRCYCGMEPRDDVLWFNPKLPDELPSVRMRVRYRGHWLSVFIDHEELRIFVDRSLYAAAQIGFGDKIYPIRQGEFKVFRLRTPQKPVIRKTG